MDEPSSSLCRCEWNDLVIVGPVAEPEPWLAPRHLAFLLRGVCVFTARRILGTAR